MADVPSAPTDVAKNRPGLTNVTGKKFAIPAVLAIAVGAGLLIWFVTRGRQRSEAQAVAQPGYPNPTGTADVSANELAGLQMQMSNLGAMLNNQYQALANQNQPSSTTPQPGQPAPPSFALQNPFTSEFNVPSLRGRIPLYSSAGAGAPIGSTVLPGTQVESTGPSVYSGGDIFYPVRYQGQSYYANYQNLPPGVGGGGGGGDRPVGIGGAVRSPLNAPNSVAFDTPAGPNFAMN